MSSVKVKKTHPKPFAGTCVYLHRRATDNQVFYIGIGSRARCMSGTARNDKWLKVKQEHGFTVQVVEVFDNPSDARTAEMELIDLAKQMGVYLTNLSGGGEGGLPPFTTPIDVAMAEARALVANLGKPFVAPLAKVEKPTAKPVAVKPPRPVLRQYPSKEAMKQWLDAMWDKRRAKAHA